MKSEPQPPMDMFDWNEWRQEEEQKRRSGAPSGSEPLRKSFSQEEIVAAAKQWIREKYPATEHDQDLRMTRLGLLIDFVTDLIPNDKD